MVTWSTSHATIWAVLVQHIPLFPWNNRSVPSALLVFKLESLINHSVRETRKKVGCGENFDILYSWTVVQRSPEYVEQMAEVPGSRESFLIWTGQKCTIPVQKSQGERMISENCGTQGCWLSGPHIHEGSCHRVGFSEADRVWHADCSYGCLWKEEHRGRIGPRER